MAKIRFLFLITAILYGINVVANGEYCCEYCGAKYSSVSSLTSSNCPHHPNGAYKGRHKLFEGHANAKKIYCKYCGTAYSSISSLTSGKCSRHPDGSYKGRHSPYEGTGKNQYTCKYCGNKYSSISSLTSSKCSRHPDGAYKGYHSPAK